MVVVGAREEAQATTTSNLDSSRANRGALALSHSTATNTVRSEAPPLPRKRSSARHSGQEYVLCATREPNVREVCRDSPTFHEYVNIEASRADHRPVFDIRRLRNDSLDSSAEESYSSRYLTPFYGEYECMSSPESFSTSSSNRSSNTSSLAHGSSSPDSASLSSFTDRFIFGGKRCSQVSTASSRRSSKSSLLSWSRDDNYDGANTYENIAQDQLRRNRAVMSSNASAVPEDDNPPPLPVRQQTASTIVSNKPPEVELILPYKVVDLEELQRSLNDIETYNSSDSDDTNIYNECSESPSGNFERELDHIKTTAKDARPALPPKRKYLSASLSDSVIPTVHTCNGEVAKEKPTPAPRQSAIFKDTTGLDKQNSESDEDSLTRSLPTNGHLSRQGSLPSHRVGHSRRQSSSPHQAARPRRSAPPPPPPPSSSHHEKSPSVRPVSEMLPRNQSWNQFPPTDLKRSNTVSMVQFPSSSPDLPPSILNRYSVQVSPTPPSTVPSSPPPPAQADSTKEDNGKSGSSKTFFSKSKALKKALAKAVTKKQPKKELVIGPPTDFASLYQPPVTADRPDRERKTVSFVDSLEVGDESLVDDPENDEDVYRNFPISQADDCPDEPACPQKPPRRFTSPDMMGYLQPSTSQKTKDQEEEISKNKTPELGPLPTTPASSPETEVTPSKAPSDDSSTMSVIKNENVSNTVKIAKPKVPRRPDGLKPKLQKKPQVTKAKESQSETPDADALESLAHSVSSQNDTVHATDAATTRVSGRSRSCETLEDSTDSYLTSLYLTVLKDILLRWRNMLRRPKISLSGACWEDFEVVEGGSWPKVSEDHSSILQPVQLRKSSLNLDSNHSDGQFIAKIKSQTQQTSVSKSCYDQDYSVCSIVESHENVARVLAYFRGDIRPQLVGLAASAQDFHTTISITDQVSSMTCDELVTSSVELHNSDPYSYERVISMLVLQCLLGLDHLHNTGFAHGNLVLSNLFLIKHANDFQLFLGNLGRSQPLPKERRGTGGSQSDVDPTASSGVRSDLSAVSDLISTMLHSTKDQNSNVVKCTTSPNGNVQCPTSPLFELLCKVSERLRDGTATLRQAVGFVRSFLWGPFKIDERCVLSEARAASWLDRQRGEFVAKLAMDECLARTVSHQHRTRFSMEDFLLCDYLNNTQPKYLLETAQCWFYET